MSFSGKVKEELVKHIPNARHCQIAQITAMITMEGKVSISAKEEYRIIVTTESIYVATCYYELLRRAFRICPETVCRKNRLVSGGYTYQVLVLQHDEAMKILEATKLIHPVDISGDAYSNIYEDTIQHLVVQNLCCKRAFLKGSFLAAGSISDPQKGYHFEIVCDSEEKAVMMKEMMECFELEPKIIPRKKYFVLYLKEGSMIADMLKIMEAHISLLEFENVRILRDVRNDVNRKVNCETANLNKTVNAAVKQVEDILYLKEQGKLLDLPKSLLEIADLRLEYQDASLKELGGMLNPPVGKSGVNHRLRKISNYANEIREKEENKF